MSPELKKKQDELVQQLLAMIRSCSPRELLWIAEAARKKSIEELDRYRGQRVMLGANFPPVPHYMPPMPGEEEPDMAGLVERADDNLRRAEHQIAVIDSMCRLLDFMSMRSSVDDFVDAMRQRAKEGAAK